jgi:hypothetical protein
LDGQPVEGAKVVFVGDGDPKLGTYQGGPTDKTGKYSLYGPTGSGIPLGKYKIIVTKTVRRDGKPLGEDMSEDEAREQGVLKNELPEIYAQHDTTTLGAVIKAGSNPVDLKLTGSK